MTINISSPNTENLRSFHNYKELDELLNLIKKEKQDLNTNIPIALKISPDLEEKNIKEISELIIKYNLELLIVSNTTDRNRENLKNVNKFEKGGLSGKPLEIKSNLVSINVVKKEASCRPFGVFKP